MAKTGGTIKGITVEIGGDTTKLGTALKSVNSSTKSLQSELRGVNSLLKMDPGNVTLLQQKQELLTKSINETNDKLKILKETQSQVQEQFDKGEITEEQYRDFQREIVATEEKLKSLKKEAKDFGSVFQQQCEVAGQKVKDVGSKIEDAGKKASLVSTAAAGALTLTAKTAIDFESAWTGVTKTVDGTPKRLEEIRQGLLDLSESTSSSAIDIASVAEAAGQLGVTQENILTFTETMVRLGDSTDIVADEAATAIAQLYNIMGADINTVDRFGATLVELGNNSATSESKIMNMASRIGAAGVQIGLSEQNVLALSATLASVGLEAEGGGSAISAVMTEIDKSVALNADSLNEWANVAEMSVNDFKYLWENDAMSAMQKIIAGMGNAKSGGENLNVMLDELGVTSLRQTDTMKRLSSAADLLTGSVELSNSAWNENTALSNESDKRYETTAAKITQLKNTVTELCVKLGDILLPIIQNITDKVKNLVEKFTNMSPTVQKVTLAVLGIASALGPFLIIIGKVVSSIGSIITIIPKVTKAFSAIKTAMSASFLTNPVFLVIAAIAAVIAALVLLYKNCEPFREFVDNLWAKIKDFFKDVGEWFKNLWENISEFFEKVKTFFTETIPNAVSEFWNKVKIFFTETIPNAVIDFVENIKTFFTENWKALLLLIVNPFAGAFKLLYDNCEGFRNFVNDFIEKVKMLFTNGLENIKAFFTEKIPELINNIITWFSELPNKIYNAIISTVDKIKTWENKIKTTAINAIKNLITNVINNAKTLPGKIADAINGAIIRVVTWGSDMVIQARDAMSNVVSSVTSKLKELPDKVTSIGRDIIEGLWNGINDKVEWIKNKIVFFKDQVIDQLKNVFDIHSPSRLLKTEIGYRLAEGVGEGITESNAPSDAMAKLRNNILNESEGINGVTLKRQIENTFKNNSSNDNGLLNRLDAILTKLDKNTQIVLDTGVLVGETINDYDAALGAKSTKLARGW